MGSLVKQHIEEKTEWFYVCPVDIALGTDAHLAIAKVETDQSVGMCVWGYAIGYQPNDKPKRLFAFWIPKEHAAKFIGDYKKRAGK